MSGSAADTCAFTLAVRSCLKKRSLAVLACWATSMRICNALGRSAVLQDSRWLSAQVLHENRILQGRRVHKSRLFAIPDPLRSDDTATAWSCIQDFTVARGRHSVACGRPAQHKLLYVAIAGAYLGRRQAKTTTRRTESFVICAAPRDCGSRCASISTVAEYAKWKSRIKI